MSYKTIRKACYASVLFAAFSSAKASDWQSYQHDPGHSGRTDASPDPNALELKWSAPLGYGTPLIVGDSIIAICKTTGTGSPPTTISSFQIETGALNWSYSGVFTFPSQAAYGNGVVAFNAGIAGPDAQKLIVLDAVTGALKYKVPSGISSLIPTIATDSNGRTIAYLADDSKLVAVELGENSGNVLWSATASYGGQSIPTVAGANTLLMAGPGHYHAVDRATGAQNHFFGGGVSGGGGDTVVFDSARSQFYVLDLYNPTNSLTAYHLGENYSDVTQLWQRTGTGIGNGGQVAIGPTGKVYSLSTTTLVELDPVTGEILRSVGGEFATSQAPLIAGDFLWAFGVNKTYAYDLASLSLVNSLPGSRGNVNTAYDSPGAVDDTHFVIDYGNISGRHGFDVYAVPEPQMLGFLIISLTYAIGRRRQT